MTPIDLAALPDELLIPGLADWLGVDTDTPPETDTDTLLSISELNQRIARLEQQIAEAREHGHAARTARDYADSLTAGYIDHSFLER